MIFRVTCAFVNTLGDIEIESQDFSTTSANLAVVAAQEYFTDKYSECNRFVYSDPKQQKPRSEGIRMTQTNYGNAQGRQIIIGGDAVQGSYVTGDKIVIG